MRAGVLSLGELGPHHMCLASSFVHVSTAERRNDENAFWTHFFQALPGRHFLAGFIVLPSTLTSTVTSTVTSI